MSWLKKANHVLFFAGACIALVLGTTLLVDWAGDVYRRWTRPPRDEVVSTDRAERLAKDEKRLNLVSTNHAELIDASRALYLVPIAQERLREPVSYQATISQMTAASSSRSRNQTASEWRSYLVAQGRGAYNNLLLYRRTTGERTVLFDERVGVTEWMVVNDPTSYSLFVLLASTDTNDDGVLRPDDRRRLVEYRLDTGEQRALTDSSRYVRGLDYRPRDQTLFLTLGVDHDGDGTFQSETEPTRLYRVDREAGTLTPVVPDSTRSRLQSILDARPQ
jgi:hypothetical protein